MEAKMKLPYLYIFPILMLIDDDNVLFYILFSIRIVFSIFVIIWLLAVCVSVRVADASFSFVVFLVYVWL